MSEKAIRIATVGFQVKEPKAQYGKKGKKK
jgi:hypothetical protein